MAALQTQRWLRRRLHLCGRGELGREVLVRDAKGGVEDDARRQRQREAEDSDGACGSEGRGEGKSVVRRRRRAERLPQPRTKVREAHTCRLEEAAAGVVVLELALRGGAAGRADGELGARLVDGVLDLPPVAAGE